MSEDNLYSKEYKAYMEYALIQYLINDKSYSEEDAKLKVAQQFDQVMEDAKKEGFL